MVGRSQQCDRAAGAVISFNLADAVAHKATRPGTTSRQPPHARQCNTCAPVDAAKNVGKLIAERAKAANIAQVVFDRNGFLYHGRVAALADAAREAGLSF